MRIIVVLLISFIFCYSSAELRASEPVEPVSLDRLLAEALERNPTLAAAKARADAARLRIPQASALPDPTVGYSFMGEMLETRLGPQEDVFEVEQMVPFPGKLLARRGAASADAKAARARLAMAERDTIYEVTEAYYDLYAADASIEALEDVLELVKGFEGVAQARYASQGGGQGDVAKAQIIVSETLQRLFVLRQRRGTLAALLNALLDRAPQDPVGRPLAPTVPAVRASAEELTELARRHRPQLLEAQQMLQRERHASSIAKMDYLPDVSVGFEYVAIGAGMTSDPDDGRDAWMVPVKLTVPLWQNRLLPGVLEAKRNVKAGQAELVRAENLTEYDVRRALYAFTAARQVVELHENALIPEAELAFRSDQAGYEAGRTPILNLIDSERVYLNTKVAYYDAVAEAMKSFADLERAVGTDLVTSEAK